MNINRIGYVEICNDCSYKEFRLDYPLDAYRALQTRLLSKGKMSCSRCNGHNVTMNQLKLKDIKALWRKFPKNMVIYTEHTLEQLLALPDGDPENLKRVDALYKEWKGKEKVKR